MSTHGGKRMNSGRPKGSKTELTKETKSVRKAIITGVKRQRQALFIAMLDSALGLWYEDPFKKRIYRCKPDIKAATYLFDQTVGKPKEMAELTGKDGAPIQFNYHNMDINDLDSALKSILKK